MIQIIRSSPHYDLVQLKKLISNRETRHITDKAMSTAYSVGYASVKEIVAAVMTLSITDFYKPMESTDFPGTFQDVYKKNINGVKLYIKLQERPKGKGVVISFKKA